MRRRLRKRTQKERAMNNNNDPYTVAFIATSGFLITTILLMRYEEKIIQAHRKRMARANRLDNQRITAAKGRHPSSRGTAQ